MNLLENPAVTAKGKPLGAPAIPPTWEPVLAEYCSLLLEANGLEIAHGLFRVFGVGHGCLGRDALAWNSSAWRSAYRIPGSIVMWAENVFGDQYGVDAKSGDLVVLNCEGGAMDRPEAATIRGVLQRMLLGQGMLSHDVELAEVAWRMGMRPTMTEHLSFSVPLVCGGSAIPDNLEVLDGQAHLQVLGQIIEQSRDLAEGTAIRRFRG